MFEANSINRRLTKKLSLFEFGSIVFVFFIFIYIMLSKTSKFDDLEIYLATAKGDVENYFYGYWLLPIFHLLSLLPYEFSCMLWIILSIIGVWFAARVFDGNSTLAIISYQMSFVLFLGQISGIICGFLGLFWWAIHHKKWELAGLAFLVISAKPQSGGLIVLLLWFFSEINWQHKLRILLIPIFGFLISLIIYPNWVMEIISRVDGLVTWGNISLWQWIGPWTFILFIPILILHIPKQDRFLILVSTFILSSPYFSHHDLLTLFIFPIGIIPILLGYIPAILFQFFGYEGQPSGVLIPLFIYFSLLFPKISRKLSFEKSNKNDN